MRFLFFILIPVFVFSQNVSKEFSDLNSSIKRENYYSAIINSLALSDKLFLFLEGYMLNSIPDLKNYNLYNTNTFSRIVMQKGNYEIELYSQKFFSNKNINLIVTIDANEDAFNRNLNLFVSFDFLSDKKGFKKLEIQKTPLLIENNAVTMLQIISTNEKKEGFTIKMEYNFLTKIDSKTKDEIILNDAKEIIRSLNTQRLKRYLR